ncbi:MAG: TIGR00730 family Rossman fold protein [Sandaracinaceae bacterium]|nr:TIGR00730 family Rossman fold protein [Sandaracinaceae bacterium]
MSKLVALYCASNADDVPALVQGTEALVDALADRGLGVVYGGARVGLMGVVARRALARGIEIVGVIPRRLLDRELLMPGLSRTEIVDTMSERKAIMSREACAFVALPGAIGTLDEILEEWTTRHLGIHDKPIGFLDVDGYWSPFLAALETMRARGVVRDAHLAIPVVRSEAGPLLDAMRIA